MNGFASSRRVCIFSIFALGLGFPVTADAADISRIRQRGWEAMCLRDDQPINFCSSFSGPRQIPYSRDLEAVLSSISLNINATYRFQSDRSAYGVGDRWSVPTGNTADCEDYVLAKIVALYQQGYPVSAMVILIGQLSNGRWHSTLGVQTDAGMIVLDSLSAGTVARLNFRTAYYLEMHDTSSWRIVQ
ncbi:transglutaminase-like cysteine peptidase [Devosia sp.]|uniref:transglutaminase-like cysteine peptidase n=1 Tax=Devosia sp. TaxID=1871048 RepID=UPI002FC63799